MADRICIQTEDFSIERETGWLRENSNNTGALVTFTGLVRELHEDAEVSALFLEHYPGMTEASLQTIIKEARTRGPLQAVTVIHRIGKLLAGEQIVFVGVSSRHRHAAFAACEFIMDFLKTRAPFWKKSLQADGAHWVEAKASDTEASLRWESGHGKPGN